MCFSLVMLFLCFSQTELGSVWAQQQTGSWYGESSRADSRTHRAHRSSSGHSRLSRAVLGGGLTIDTLPDNTTHLVEDSGRYYTWRSFGSEDQRTQELWIDMGDLQHGQVRVHGILSNTHRQAARVALSFDFPFYGHYLRQITIATGGFIFMGDVTHRMLTATQYIAPLMANFDPSFSKESTVQYLDNGEVFVVQWDHVRLQGKESAGSFTFQAALHRTGTITFCYRDVPLSVEMINSAQHPVKAGLSDAFTVMTPSPQSADTQQRTIYEYHRVEIDTTKITNHSAFEFTALPTCLQHDSCELCLTSNQTSGCSWCNVLQRCSDGMDRHRQEWLDYACAEESKDASCEDYTRGGHDSSVGPSVTPEMEAITPLTPIQTVCDSDDDTKHHILSNGNDLKPDSPIQSAGLSNTGVIAGVAAAAVLLLALVLVALYINYHPAAASPLYFIQRRKDYWPSLKFQKQGFQPGYTEVEGEGHDKESIVEAGPC
ncbi:plexin domain-containing protein 1-like [Myripristis murdjan]|uniref:plexin domain-containing protein 1-like n=1 Tax=Myripristis murdjan TaxID=586833 RepID=UPI001175E67F|nr:plexin domain-containing protein 1-like [Myripristis murdjan]